MDVAGKLRLALTFRGQYTALLSVLGFATAGGALADPGLKLTPSVGLQELYTDNSTGAGSSTTSSVTQFQPGISISGETPTTNINFTYSPAVSLYNDGSQKTRIDQNLNGVATIKPFDEYLTIDVLTYAIQAGASGDSTNAPGVLLPTDNRLLYYIARVAPHFQAHFSDVATLDAFYRINSTNVSDESTRAPGFPSVSSNSLDRDAEVQIGSANSLGQVGVTLDFNYDQSSGSGMNTSSTNASDSLGVSYRINRAYAINSSIGYQLTDYPASGLQKAYRSEGKTWSVGAGYTPNSLSAVSIGYGYQQGSYNPSVQVGYQLGPRTKLSASYVVSVKNQLTSALQNLAFLKYDQFGNAVDGRTGLPFNALNSAFGQENVLFRDKPALLTVTHEFTRSSISMSLSYEARRALSEFNQSDKAFGITIAYSQSISPRTDVNLSVGYTKHKSSGLATPPESANDIQATALITYRITESLRATLVENYFNVLSDIPLNDTKNEQLTIGLSRDF